MQKERADDDDADLVTDTRWDAAAGLYIPSHRWVWLVPAAGRSIGQEDRIVHLLSFSLQAANQRQTEDTRRRFHPCISPVLAEMD